MIDIFRRALADKLGDDPMTPGSADVILDADTAAELIADPATLDLEGTDPMADLLAPYRPHAAGELALRQARRCQYPDGSPALRAVASVLLCTGWVRRMLRDPNTGQPLDYNRAQRRFTTRQRRALVVRDGGCVFPGCDRKPKWCDAHHLKPWEDDGPTNLDNGCLLCRRHHNLIHHKRLDPRTRPGDRDLHRHQPRRPPIHPRPQRTMSTLTGCATPPTRNRPPDRPPAHDSTAPVRRGFPVQKRQPAPEDP